MWFKYVGEVSDNAMFYCCRLPGGAAPLLLVVWSREICTVPAGVMGHMVSPPRLSLVRASFSLLSLDKVGQISGLCTVIKWNLRSVPGESYIYFTVRGSCGGITLNVPLLWLLYNDIFAKTWNMTRDQYSGTRDYVVRKCRILCRRQRERRHYIMRWTTSDISFVINIWVNL